MRRRAREGSHQGQDPDLRRQRDELTGSGDKDRLHRIRRQIHSLKRKLRRMAVDVETVG
jgi:hypothetical protein